MGRQHLPQVPGWFGPESLVTPADLQDPRVLSVQVARALPGDTGKGGAEMAHGYPCSTLILSSVAPALCLPVVSRPGPTLSGVLLLCPRPLFQSQSW